MRTKRLGEYSRKKDYHLKLNPHWPYLPVYLAKMEFVRQFLDGFDPRKKIIDLGCGEGALVKEYFEKGYKIFGLDANYQSKYVSRGDILNLKIPSRSFDLALCLDVLEHFSLADQPRALKEIKRILKPGGELLLVMPNLAHLASRFSFLFLGKLLRTSAIERHPGDRPLAEYLRLLSQVFSVLKVKGLFPTFPLISLFTLLVPAKVFFWHKIYNRLLAYPPICFETIIVARKRL